MNQPLFFCSCQLKTKEESIFRSIPHTKVHFHIKSKKIRLKNAAWDNFSIIFGANGAAFCVSHLSNQFEKFSTTYKGRCVFLSRKPAQIFLCLAFMAQVLRHRELDTVLNKRNCQRLLVSIPLIFRILTAKTFWNKLG